MADDEIGSVPDVPAPAAALPSAPRLWDRFKWLALGHILYAIVLLVVAYWDVDLGNIWITPLFALPLVVAGGRKRLIERALVMLLGFTAIHYEAMSLTMSLYTQQLLPGAVGGGFGGLASLALCLLFRLAPLDRPTIVWTLVGTLLLAVTGSLGVHLYLLAMGAQNSLDGPLGSAVSMLLIYTPWQLVFAFVLAKVLKPIGE